MKAGGEGSSPNGAASTDASSFLLRKLRRDIGSVSFWLNTIVIGLDAVENGYGKPKELNISWNPNPGEIRSAARESRKFAVESAVVRGAEAVKAYFRVISSLPRFSDDRGRWDREKAGAAKILRDISVRILDRDDYLISASMLLIASRNIIVHGTESKSLNSINKKIMEENSSLIADRYGNLDVERLLVDVRDRKITLKESSCLIAMSLNLAKSIDSVLFQNLEKGDIEIFIGRLGLDVVLEKIKRETSPEKLEDSMKRAFNSSAAGLYEKYREHFPTE